MNAYFDRYVHSNVMMNDSVVYYNKIVHTYQEAKEKEDFQNNEYRCYKIIHLQFYIQHF